jgi:hypothetical protein
VTTKAYSSIFYVLVNNHLGPQRVLHLQLPCLSMSHCRAHSSAQEAPWLNLAATAAALPWSNRTIATSTQTGTPPSIEGSLAVLSTRHPKGHETLSRASLLRIPIEGSSEPSTFSFHSSQPSSIWPLWIRQGFHQAFDLLPFIAFNVCVVWQVSG